MPIELHERQLIDDALRDPAKCFFEDILQVKTIYPAQRRMIEGVRDHPQTAILGCNSSGKDFTTGRLMLWWLATHYPAQVAVFGPSERQVQEVVFNEARRAMEGSVLPLGGNMAARSASYHIDTNNFALGISTNDPYNITGFHSPNLMVIITEAHGVDEEHIKLIRTLHAKRLVMTGNAFSSSGTFFNAFHSKSQLWHTIRISAFETINVIENREVIPGLITNEKIQQFKDEFGEESAMYQASVLAEFPESLSDTIVPWQIAEKARQRKTEPSGDKVAACDIARGGADSCVLCERQGMFAKFVWKHHGKKIPETAARLKQYLDENPDVTKLMIDDVGIGGGVTDLLLLSEHEERIVPFIGGNPAQNPNRFANKIAEAWWMMREAYFNGMQAPDDQNLVDQVSSRKYHILTDRKIAMESKEKLPKSPDEADSLAMTFNVPDLRPGIVIVDPNFARPQPTILGDDGELRPKTEEERAKEDRERMAELEANFAAGEDID